jgi:hypothetical protein
LTAIDERHFIAVASSLKDVNRYKLAMMVFDDTPELKVDWCEEGDGYYATSSPLYDERIVVIASHGNVAVL